MTPHHAEAEAQPSRDKGAYPMSPVNNLQSWNQNPSADTGFTFLTPATLGVLSFQNSTWSPHRHRAQSGDIPAAQDGFLMELPLSVASVPPKSSTQL